MARLEETAVEDLRAALDEVERKKPTQRLMAAIAYKNGVSQTELAEWYDVQRRTIYGWLTRFEGADSLAEAARDDDRSGRPRKLSERQRAQLEEQLHEPPSEAGYDAESWTPALVQRHLEDEFGVEYSRPSCRRLMKEAGLTYLKPPRTADDGDGDGPDDERRAGQWVPQ